MKSDRLLWAPGCSSIAFSKSSASVIDVFIFIPPNIPPSCPMCQGQLTHVCLTLRCGASGLSVGSRQLQPVVRLGRKTHNIFCHGERRHIRTTLMCLE